MSPQKKSRASTKSKAKKPSQAKTGKKKSADGRDGRIRLQRFMASAGVGSRRECELIIEEGRVEVDGNIVATLGAKVDPVKQKIYVDGQRLVQEKLQYFMLNKPPGIVSTSSDPSGRIRVIDLIKTEKRVYNVGRLDQSSEGLILVTNDGELANRLTHPRYGIQKKYHVLVAGTPATSDLKALEKGVYLAEGKAKATSAKFLRKVKTSTWLEIVLAEGRNREIRRMLASIGNKVRTLKRVSIGPLKMGDLPIGAHRPLTVYELKALKRATEDGAAPPRPKKKFARKTGSTTASKTPSASSRRSAAGKTTAKSVPSKSGAGRSSAKGTGASKMKAAVEKVAAKKPKTKKGNAKAGSKSAAAKKRASKKRTDARAVSKKKKPSKPRRGGYTAVKKGRR